MKKAFEVNYEASTIEINRWHPLVWLIFLMNLLGGPFVVLFFKEYTFKHYVHELKCIIRGKYERL